MRLELTRLDDTDSVKSISFHFKLFKFKKKIRSLTSKITFKLKDINNYENWHQKLLSVVYFFCAQKLLKKLQQICSQDLKNENKKIWIFKFKILFIIIFTALKSAIKKTIQNDINKDTYNDIELWIALENRYKTHTVNILAVICSKLHYTQIKNFSNDISHYISSFNHHIEKLKIINH